MKKFLILGGIAASMFAPAPANAGSAQVGTPDCYVQVDYVDPNLVFCGGEPPCFAIDPEGGMGAGLHCPLT